MPEWEDARNAYREARARGSAKSIAREQETFARKIFGMARPLLRILRPPEGARQDFESSVRALGLSDQDLVQRYQEYIARARTEAVIAALLLLAAGWLWKAFGFEVGLVGALFALSRVVATYMCMARAWAIHHRQLPKLPWG